MNIQIVRKKAPIKSVTLLFKKQTLRSQYSKIPVVSIYDEESKYGTAKFEEKYNRTRIKRYTEK